MLDIKKLLNELYEYDNSLKGNKNLEDIISKMSKMNPNIKIDSQFKESLKYEINKKIIESDIWNKNISNNFFKIFFWVSAVLWVFIFWVVFYNFNFWKNNEIVLEKFQKRQNPPLFKTSMIQDEKIEENLDYETLSDEVIETQSVNEITSLKIDSEWWDAQLRWISLQTIDKPSMDINIEWDIEIESMSFGLTKDSYNEDKEIDWSVSIRSMTVETWEEFILSKSWYFYLWVINFDKLVRFEDSINLDNYDFNLDNILTILNLKYPVDKQVQLKKQDFFVQDNDLYIKFSTNNNDELKINLNRNLYIYENNLIIWIK